MKQPKKIQFIDFANICSAIAVVFLHANNCFWTFSSTERYWKTANIIECIFYFAVPVFFMISGATLIDYNKRYNLKTYFEKRINKTLIPYIIWSMLGLLFQVFYLKSIKLSQVNFKMILNGLLSTSNCLVQVYWFFIPLFCIYLAIPFISEIPTQKRKKVFSYIVIIQFFFDALIPFISSVFNLEIQNNFIGISNSYLIYLFLGYLLTHYEIKPSLRVLSYISGLLGLSLHIFGTYFSSIQAGKLITIYKGYMNVPCLLYSTAIFIFFRYGGQKIMQNQIICNIINKIKKYTFSLYLMHWYILQILLRHFAINEASIIYRLTAPFIALGITIIITIIIRKIPVIKRILP